MLMLLVYTSSNKEIKVGLNVKGKTQWLKKGINYQKAQVVLPLIDELLRKHRVKLSDIDEIRVHTGPGSFTGIRVGMSVANALGWTLNIPVVPLTD